MLEYAFNAHEIDAELLEQLAKKQVNQKKSKKVLQSVE
jgi:hypothetical protein